MPIKGVITNERFPEPFTNITILKGSSLGALN
jgi:hypothetical protein